MRENGTARSFLPLAGVSAFIVAEVSSTGARTGDVGAMVSLESEPCRSFLMIFVFFVFLTTLTSASLSLEESLDDEESLDESLSDELEDFASAISSSEPE